MDTPPTEGADGVIALGENKYGKSRVRVVQVTRRGDRNDFREWTVEILFTGDFESCFVDGDNRNILPTDTMKNTVYSLARESSQTCMEEFGQELADFFLDHNPRLSATQVSISEKTWERAMVEGKPHPTTFVQSSGELQTSETSRARDGASSVWSGLENLIIMKTAGSEFAGFLKDSLTTLPESTDRLLGTALRARWKYSTMDVSFRTLRKSIRQILLGVFAGHASKSVQHTLYAMGEAVLQQIPDVDEIELNMPNRHCLLVDLSRFGQDNPNEIFVPVDEPHGYIEARIRRQD
jgi:urate oxidase